ncbi:MAG TPA: nicotinate phosphoribosyltransferase [Acidimicrobiales bacterium]|nr:nicotinate phosphoribosyltransferase [Acidimicrobiales bacterium]
MSGGLRTDLYELNMAASYLRHAMNDTATFSLFVRALPPERGFLVAAGLGACLDWLEQFRFDAEELEYLATVGFDDASLEAFSTLRFTGDVWAVPEGRIVFAQEPLLEVTAPVAEAQLAETVLLNQITFQTTLASKAARCRLAAADRLDLVEFGLRRTQGIEAGMAAARVAAMVGFVATSNVEAARRYGLRPSGTMAHSFVEAFPTEIDAFRTYARDHPRGVTLLVDTYDTSTGMANAITVITELGLGEDAAVRLDSGDLGALAHQARRMLDAAGLPRVRILVSGGLDEHDLARLVADGAPVDAAGVGTRLGVSADAPFLDSAYKLVSFAGRPVMKLSPGKVSLPGAKQVFRGPSMRDTIGLRDEEPPVGTRPLLEPVMHGGRRVDPVVATVPAGGPVADITAARARFEADLADLPPGARALDAPQAVVPGSTAALRSTAERAEAAARRSGGVPPS